MNNPFDFSGEEFQLNLERIKKENERKQLKNMLKEILIELKDEEQTKDWTLESARNDYIKKNI